MTDPITMTITVDTPGGTVADLKLSTHHLNFTRIRQAIEAGRVHIPDADEVEDSDLPELLDRLSSKIRIQALINQQADGRWTANEVVVARAVQQVAARLAARAVERMQRDIEAPQLFHMEK